MFICVGTSTNLSFKKDSCIKWIKNKLLLNYSLHNNVDKLGHLIRLLKETPLPLSYGLLYWISKIMLYLGSNFRNGRTREGLEKYLYNYTCRIQQCPLKLIKSLKRKTSINLILEVFKLKNLRELSQP